ncbi:MAG: DUF427 domain-containing protein [Gemmatimonadaceae bacterium]
MVAERAKDDVEPRLMFNHTVEHICRRRVVNRFTPSDHRSVCGWKGPASYFDVRVNDAVNPASAWEYRDPKPDAAAASGRIGFWRGVQIEP